MYKFLYLFLLLIISPVNAEILRPRVFVSIPPQKQFVEKIAGDKVDVAVMLPPGESPETFSPSPRKILSLAKAVSYFQIGVPFEKVWLSSIRAVNKDMKIVQCCDQIYFSQNQLTHEHNNESHVWTNPINVQKMAKTILDELIRIDPSNIDEYKQNYYKFFFSLRDLDIAIKTRLSSRKTDYFIISHSGWTAFANHYQLEQLSLEKNGKEIGPRSLMEIVRLARQEKLNTLFVMAQYQTPFIDNLAAELAAKVVNLDPLVEDYMTNMYLVMNKLAISLGAR